MSGLQPDGAAACAFCARTAADIPGVTDAAAAQLHESLCTGPWVPPTTCALCDAPVPDATPSMLIFHYVRIHGVASDEAAGHAETFRTLFAHPSPDLHQQFGVQASALNPVYAFPDLRRDSARFARFPLNPPLKPLLEAYRTEFASYTQGAVPCTFHLHTSDMAPDMVVTVLTALIDHLKGPEVNLFLDEHDTRGRRATEVAVLGNCYGAGYGPLAHTSPIQYMRAAASGAQPHVLNVSTPRALERQIDALPSTCSLVLAQIVSSTDGAVLSPLQWAAIHRACTRRRLFLVLDDAISAVRCGAPFSYLHPEYVQYKPSCVLFGKALLVCGLAVCPDGAVIDKLGFTASSLANAAAKDLDGRVSVPCEYGILLRASAILRQAMLQDWAGRARTIGAQLTQHAVRLGVPEDDVRGMHALMWLPARPVARSQVLGAASGGDYTRWLPALDSAMLSPAYFAAVFDGAYGHVLRRAHFSNNIALAEFCLLCGDYNDSKQRTCVRCCAAICGNCSNDEEAQPHWDETC